MKKFTIAFRLSSEHMSHIVRKPVFALTNNKGADQPAHPRSMISAFIIRCHDGIVPILYKSEN